MLMGHNKYEPSKIESEYDQPQQLVGDLSLEAVDCGLRGNEPRLPCLPLST
jgi:hypothetical protein